MLLKILTNLSKVGQKYHLISFVLECEISIHVLFYTHFRLLYFHNKGYNKASMATFHNRKVVTDEKEKS